MIDTSVFLDSPECRFTFLGYIGFNLFADPVRDINGVPGIMQTPPAPAANAEDVLRFDLDLWHTLTGALADAGCKRMVLFIGEGMKYESHPEISCRGALPKEIIEEEIFNLKMRGIEAIPYLNFSAVSAAWMGAYGRMVSTTSYYHFCEDVISEVCEVFGRPRLFHLGMNAEDASRQKNRNLVVSRQGELWWHDLLFLAQTTMHYGARPWIWSDAMDSNPTEFLSKMPRDIVQSYPDAGNANAEQHVLSAAEMLAHAGFDLIPAKRTTAKRPLSHLVQLTNPLIPQEQLLGYLQDVQLPCLPLYARELRRGIRALKNAFSADDTET